MASREGRRHRHDLVPLAALISREMRNEKMEKPNVRFGQAAQSRKGEDYFLIKTDCQRVPGNPSSTFFVFAVNLVPYSLISLLYVVIALLQGLVFSNLVACIFSLVHSQLKVLVLIS